MIRRHRRESCLVVEILTPVASSVAMKIKTKWQEWVGLTGNGQGSLGHGRSEGCLVCEFKYIFSVFKQYYTYFHILFHLYVFLKKLKTVV